MIQTESKEIDGIQFQVGGLDLRTERTMLVKLVKTLGPALAEFMKGGDTKASAPEALRLLVETMDEADVNYLCDTFAKVTKVGMTIVTAGGDTTQWVPYTEGAFKNGAASQMKWLWFCLEHQFAGFLGESSGKLGSLLGQIKAKASP